MVQKIKAKKLPTSQSDGTWTGDWPTCADITSCPDPTTLDHPDEIETTWTTGDSTDFQTKITWKCKDRRYLIQRIGNETTRGETIENQCLWYSNYTFLPSDLECILTYCDQVQTKMLSKFTFPLTADRRTKRLWVQLRFCVGQSSDPA